MIHARGKRLAPHGPTEPRPSARRLRTAGRWAAALLHRGLRLLMDVAVRVYFRRLETTGRDRFPADGAVLVVANHPAAWTDVLVLDVALRRDLHFIAHETLYHPWIRGVFLRLFESLPVRYRQEEPRAAALNRETFDRCHALFRRGAAIAMFPEGMSGSDRGLCPLKTGAARLLLEHAAAGNPVPALIPVAIYYEDRTRFRTLVELAVGAPIPVAAAASRGGDQDTASHALTGEVARALKTALAVSARAATRYRAPPGAAAPRARVRAAAWLESLLATIGMVLHAAPATTIEWLARRLTGLPQRISFGRIVAGVMLIPLWYGVLAVVASRLGGDAWFAIPAAAPFLGALACREVDRRLARQAAAAPPAEGKPA